MWSFSLELEVEVMVDLAYSTALHNSHATLESSFQTMTSASFDYFFYVILQVRFVDEA